MRVLLLHHDPGLPSDSDGPHALARALAARGAIVDLVTAGICDGVQSELLWDGTAVSEGLLTTYRVRCRRAGTFGYLGAAIPVTRRLLQLERYDVVHATPALPAGAMLPFLDLHGAPVIVSLGEADVPGVRAEGTDKAGTRRVLRLLSRWLWRRADRVIAGADATGRLARRTLPELRYTVIPSGVDVARFRPRLRRDRTGERLRCLAVAPPGGQRELTALLRAIAAQPPDTVELEIVEAGPAAPGLAALVGELGLDRSVTITGPLDGAARARRYREADLFALTGTPALSETHVAEAMASGLPLVGSTTAAPELVRDGTHGILVPPDDPRALAQVIRQLAEHSRLRAELGRRNRAHAEEHLGWERISARHLSIYRGVQRRQPARQLLAEQPSSTW